MWFQALSKVVAWYVCSCLNLTLSSNIRFITARPALSASYLARAIQSHASKFHLKLEPAVSNPRNTRLRRFFKVAQSFKNCANGLPFKSVWPNVTFFFESKIMVWNYFPVKDLNSFGLAQDTSLVTIIDSLNLWPEVRASFKNAFKSGSLKLLRNGPIRMKEKSKE